MPQFASDNTQQVPNLGITSQIGFHLSPNQNRLKRVLSAFTYYDHGIGYMQGMNFIMASIMYHCNEEIAFWVFVQLIQMKGDVRSVYEPPDMPGLRHRVKIMENLIQLKMPRLN